MLTLWLMGHLVGAFLIMNVHIFLEGLSLTVSESACKTFIILVFNAYILHIL